MTDNTNIVPWTDTTPKTYNFSEFSSGKMSYSSIQPTDTQSRITVYNLTQDKAQRLSDMVGQEIPISDVICQTVTVRNENGISTEAPRIILVTPDLQGYACVSNGIYNSIGKLFEIFGMPHWDEPIVVVPKLIKRGKNQILTLTLKE